MFAWQARISESRTVIQQQFTRQRPAFWWWESFNRSAWRWMGWLTCLFFQLNIDYFMLTLYLWCVNADRLVYSCQLCLQRTILRGWMNAIFCLQGPETQSHKTTHKTNNYMNSITPPCKSFFLLSQTISSLWPLISWSLNVVISVHEL